jgi:hypothetical protein
VIRPRSGVEPTRVRADTFACAKVANLVHPCEGVTARVPAAAARTPPSNIMRITRALDYATAWIVHPKD